MGRVVRLTIAEKDNRVRYAIGLFNPDVWEKVSGTEVTNLVLYYAFELLHLYRVDLRVIASTERAVNCYKKCGFVQGGIEREGALIDGNTKPICL